MDRQGNYLLNMPEGEAIDLLRWVHGFGEVEAFHMLEVMRGNIGDSDPPPEDSDSEAE